MELQVGQTFEDYEILGILGAGGMGKVYKVRNKISNRIEAMKVLLSDLSVEPELVDRFTREIRIFGSLDHPNIAELRTALRVENQLVMIMEYVEGSTLDALMKQSRIAKEKYLDYMCQALSALSYAHGKGVVHRDIKPSNIMVTPTGVVKLMDFGIAKAITDPRLTQSGVVVGSVYYVSPEQIEGKTLDARSDLYSLGVTLYELAAGKRPFDGTSDYQIISAHLKESPPPPKDVDASVPQELSDIVMLALERDPARRFQTADAFRNALSSVAGAAAKPFVAAVATAQTVPQTPPPPPAVGTLSITPTPAVSAKRNTRLMYMLLGSAATIAVILAAFVELPKFMHTSAASKQTPSKQTTTSQQTPPVNAPPKPDAAPPPQQQTSTSTAQTQTTPQTPPATSDQPQASNSTAPRSTRNQVQQQSQQIPQPQQPPQQQQQQATQRPPAQPEPTLTTNTNSPALAEVRDRSNLMSVRVSAVRTSFQNLQRQHEASGLGTRGDMVAADQRMEYQMQQAEAAMQQGDVEGAKKRLDMAERDLETLEKFLGR